MKLEQAESGIGATVAFLPTLETGRITGVNERYVFVAFVNQGIVCFPVACYAHDLVWYYGPIVAQLMAEAIRNRGERWKTLPQTSASTSEE